MKFILITVISAGMWLTACKTTPEPLPANGISSNSGGLGADASEMRVPGSNLTVAQMRRLRASLGEYKLGGGDVVSLWAEDIIGLNRKFVLGPDGKVTIPGIGVVNLEGMTREQAMTLVENQLKQTYREPKVSLLIEEYNNNRISVLGDVQSPGEYSFSGSTTLLNVLAKAGGPTVTADLESCTIVRGEMVVAQIDLNELLHKGNLALNIPLHPKDSVYIRSKTPETADETQTFYVLGEVKDPGMFPVTVGGSKTMDPLRAISMAGGNTEDAEMGRVRIVRRNGQGPPTVIKIDLDDVLHGRQIKLPEILSGDIVFVPKKGLATFR